MRGQFWMAAATIAACLMGCGGGSDHSSNEAADGNLYVTFEYPAQTRSYKLFDAINVAPVVKGLGGSTAHFSANTEASPLPMGFTYAESSGVIGGHAAFGARDHGLGGG